MYNKVTVITTIMKADEGLESCVISVIHDAMYKYWNKKKRK